MSTFMHIFNLQKGNGESLCQIYMEKGEWGFITPNFYMGKGKWGFIYAENKNVTGGGSEETIF